MIFRVDLHAQPAGPCAPVGAQGRSVGSLEIRSRRNLTVEGGTVPSTPLANRSVRMAALPTGSIVSRSASPSQEGTMRPITGAFSLVPLRTTSVLSPFDHTPATGTPPAS